MAIRLNAAALMERAKSAGHITQEDIAAHAGIGRPTLSKLLQGKSVPKIGTLVSLRDAYEFPHVDALLTGADRTAPAVPAQTRAAA